MDYLVYVGSTLCMLGRRDIKTRLRVAFDCAVVLGVDSRPSRARNNLVVVKALFPVFGPFIPAVLAAMLFPVHAKPSMRDQGEVVGEVRVQFLSPTLVRLELKGWEGFEDRNTFTVVKRPKPLGDVQRTDANGKTVFKRGDLEVDVPDPKTLRGVTVLLAGNEVYECDGNPPPDSFFPAPGSMPKSIAIADNPRMVPPKWGAKPAPDNNKIHVATSGWDLGNQSTDIYVFVPSDYASFRKEFLALIGPIPMPPLYYFGFWHSRYHPYSDRDVLDVIDTYRKKDIPLDAFVVDTDWRIGASHGYAVNTKLFPDMQKFITDVHARHVKVMYNDHPEPVSKEALDPKELQYRYEGLASLLRMGADVWWYDRNWGTHLEEPAGLPKEVWGAALFHDITQEVHPDQRPLLMSNVPGIDNGLRRYAPHPATHRYPSWWTGDITGNWDYLKGGIANAVDGGVESLLPYMSEDLGGHFGNPNPEIYSRFVEYGTLSPMARVHCTAGEVRDPWVFGPEAEGIVRDYVKLRYRLLPTIYTAARQAYDSGMPIVRRCDLYWPNRPEAKRSDQYLLGDNILVAPVLESGETQPENIPLELFRHGDHEPGLKGEYYPNKVLSGAPQLIRMDPTIDFNWGFGAPLPGMPDSQFSMRWTGKLGPLPVSGKYRFVATTDDGCRLFIDDHQVIDEWKINHLPNSGVIQLEQGKTYDLRMEYFNDGQEGSARLQWIPPDQPAAPPAQRTVWIPPGDWQNLWTGQIVAGPTDVTETCPLRKTPMFVRRGSLVFLAPEMEYTGQHPWDAITIEAYPAASGSSKQLLYEDDGISNAYVEGHFSRTEFQMGRTGKTVTLQIKPLKGDFQGKLANRRWIARIHLPDSVSSASVRVDGQLVKSQIITARALRMEEDMPLRGQGADGAGTVVELETGKLSTSEPHAIEITLG